MFVTEVFSWDLNNKHNSCWQAVIDEGIKAGSVQNVRLQCMKKKLFTFTVYYSHKLNRYTDEYIDIVLLYPALVVILTDLKMCTDLSTVYGG